MSFAIPRFSCFVPLVFWEILTKPVLFFIVTLSTFRNLLVFQADDINYFHRLFLIAKYAIIFMTSKLEYSCFYREILAST